MKSKKLLIFLVGLLIYHTSTSQSIYQLQYNFNTASDTITYHSFLLMYNNGSGLAKIRYTEPASKTEIVAEMNTTEHFSIDKAGKEDTNTLVIQAVRTKITRGDNKITFQAPVFILKKNTATGYFEPAGVSLSTADPEILPGTSFASEFIDGSGLKKDFMLQYFNRDEELYTSLFAPGARGFTAAEKGINFFLLIVADTRDSSIGSTCMKDMNRTLETFDNLRKFLGIENFKTKTIYDADLSKKNVLTAVDDFIKPSPYDIVVFYYTGHGFRLEDEKRVFPYIKLKTFHTTRKDIIANSVNIEDVFTSIKKKGARFNLVISDCCNDEIGKPPVTGKAPAVGRGSRVGWNENNVRELFLNKERMSVLATAAKSGQRASGNNEFGGFFSYFFKVSMETYSSRLKSDVSWDKVLEDARNETIEKAKWTYCPTPENPKNICDQSPVYLVLIDK